MKECPSFLNSKFFTESSIHCCQLKSHWTEKSSPTLLDSLANRVLSADNRSPQVQRFCIRYIGPGISGTSLREHICKYLEWKLKTDRKITWSACDQGRWNKDRMDLSLGNSLRSQHNFKFEILSPRTLTWRDGESGLTVCNKCPELNHRASWDGILVYWGENGQWKDQSFAEEYNELSVLTVLHQSDTLSSTC